MNDDLVSYVLGEPKELAGPDFLRVVIVDDNVVGFEAAVVEIRIIVDTRIIEIGEALARKLIVSEMR